MLQQIVLLQQQLSQQTGGETTPTPTTPSPVPPTVTPPPQAAASCPNITNSLYLGLRDDESDEQVTELQTYLAQDTSIYPEGLVTGFFGPLTEQAVKRWQAGLPQTHEYHGNQSMAFLQGEQQTHPHPARGEYTEGGGVGKGLGIC